MTNELGEARDSSLILRDAFGGLWQRIAMVQEPEVFRLNQDQAFMLRKAHLMTEPRMGVYMCVYMYMIHAYVYVCAPNSVAKFCLRAQTLPTSRVGFRIQGFGFCYNPIKAIFLSEYLKTYINQEFLLLQSMQPTTLSNCVQVEAVALGTAPCLQGVRGFFMLALPRHST